MALDAKAIKEEVLDKEMYDSNARRAKGKLIKIFFYKTSKATMQTTYSFRLFEVMM